MAHKDDKNSWSKASSWDADSVIQGNVAIDDYQNEATVAVYLKQESLEDHSSTVLKEDADGDIVPDPVISEVIKKNDGFDGFLIPILR